MTKGLSKREKVLVVILAVLIVGLGWYKLIYEPVSNQISEYQLLQADAESEYLVNLPKLQKMNQMEKELETLRASGDAQQIPLYDNSKQLMVALNKVLKDTDYYDLDFGRADSVDYIVFHNVGLSYQTASYEDARDILDRLVEKTYTNQISDVNIRTTATKSDADTVESVVYGDVETGTTEVELVITFYEVAG